MTATTRLSRDGRVVIPARVRRTLGWRPGTELTFTVEVGPAGDCALVLREQTSHDPEAIVSQGYDWLEHGGPDLVKALHKSRRKARARERRLR